MKSRNTIVKISTAFIASIIFVALVSLIPSERDTNSTEQSTTQKIEEISASILAMASEFVAQSMVFDVEDIGSLKEDIAKSENESKSETEAEIEIKSKTKAKKEAEKEVKTEAAKSLFQDKFMANISEFLNVRTEPNTEAEVIGKLYAGSGGDVIERGKEWTYIKSGNLEGFVNNDYILFDEEAEKLANEICSLKVTVTTDNLRIRKEKSIESGIWELAANGETFSGISADNEWVTINYEGLEAYLSAEYVTYERQIGKGITIAEEQEKIRLENERIELERLEEERKRAEAEEAKAKIVNESKFVATVQTSGYSVTENDAYLLACVVSAEAGYEPYEGKLAVANIVLNRLRNGTYGSTMSDVIYAKGQFSVAASGILARIIANGPNAESIQAAKDALAGSNNVPSYTGFCALGSANYGSYSAYSIIGNQVFYCR